MHAFEYHRPASSKDAIGLVSKKDEAKYLAGVISSLDYALGENPLDQSYVSGY